MECKEKQNVNKERTQKKMNKKRKERKEKEMNYIIQRK